MQPPNQYPYNYPNPYQPAGPPKPRYSFRGRFVVLGLVVLMYLIACATPALEFNDPDDAIYYGFRIVIVGWLGALIGQFGWFANLFLLVGIFLLLFRRWIATFVSTVLGLAIALQTLMLFSQPVPADEAGIRHVELQHIKIGFYFWLASLLCLGVGVLILRNRERAGSQSA